MVLTGREPGEELLELADYVTEMRKVKHPFDQGIPAQKGNRINSGQNRIIQELSSLSQRM